MTRPAPANRPVGIASGSGPPRRAVRDPPRDPSSPAAPALIAHSAARLHRRTRRRATRPAMRLPGPVSALVSAAVLAQPPPQQAVNSRPRAPFQFAAPRNLAPEILTADTRSPRKKARVPPALLEPSRATQRSPSPRRAAPSLRPLRQAAPRRRFQHRGGGWRRG